MGLFLKVLGVFEVFLIYNHKFPQVLGQIICRLRIGITINVFFVTDVKLVAVIQLKEYVAGASVFILL